MAELTFVSRVTRKENLLLQRQLRVQLQIISEEYRMTKRSLEKHVRDLRDCLVCIQHTTPGLESFRHPDTRLINMKNAFKRRAQFNKLRIKQEALPQGLLNKRQLEVRSDHGERSGSDSPREELNDGCFPSTIQILEDSVSTSGLARVSTRFPKYGTAANTVQDEAWRMEVLSRFEAIFDPHVHRQQEQTMAKIPKTSGSLFTSRDVMDTATLQEDLSGRRHLGYNSGTSTKTWWPTVAVKTRLTWSATSRSKTDRIEAETRVDPLNRQLASDLGLLCASEAARVQQHPTPTLVESTFLSPHVPVGQQLQKQLLRPSTAPPKVRLPERAACVSRQETAGFLADIHSRKADIQAILKKSRQLQETVRMLAPEEQTAEDGDLMNAQSTLATTDTCE